MRATVALFSVFVVLAVGSLAGAADERYAPVISKQTPPGAVLLPRPSAAAAASDSIIAGMVAQVSEAEIYSFLEELSGEVSITLPSGTTTLSSRHAPSQGAQDAAEFLRMTLAGFGYDVAFDYFNFSSTMEAVWVGPSGTGIAVGGNGNVLVTGDSQAWELATQGLESYTAAFRGLDNVTGDGFVAVGNAGFIATSDDAGLTWTSRTSPSTRRLNDVSVQASGSGWVAGNGGTILRTTDGGLSWSAQTSGTTSNLEDVEALDGATGVAVGEAGVILRTVDGGSTWGTVASGVTQALYEVDFVGSSGWIVGGGGTVLHSTDGGASWSAQTSGTASVLRGVSFFDASNGWVVGAFSEIRHTTDGGATWTGETSPVANITLRGVHAVSASEAWLVGNTGTLERTTDAGATWENRASTIEAGWANVVATLPGTTTPQQEVLLVGHYDSISNLADPGVLAPGADDNGSGVAAIVESARRLFAARYEKTIRFVLFSAEELGLVGSNNYSAEALAAGTQIVGVFNLDSVGWNDDYFRIFSDNLSLSLGNTAASMAATYAPTLTTYHWFCDTCNWSDHWPFQQDGFPAIVGIETWVPAPPQHHTVGDTLGLMDIPLVANVTRITLSTIATVAVVDPTVPVASPVSIARTDGVRLLAVHPNPTDRATHVRYQVPRAVPVRLRIVDVTGRLVAEHRSAPRSAGVYEWSWEGTERSGALVAPGIYFCRLEAGGQRDTKRLAIVR